jgi:hypothetical protein
VPGEWRTEDQMQKCRVCNREFRPSRDWQRDCGWECHAEYVRQRALKARALLREMEREERDEQERISA